MAVPQGYRRWIVESQQHDYPRLDTPGRYFYESLTRPGEFGLLYGNGMRSAFPPSRHWFPDEHEYPSHVQLPPGA